MFVLKNAWTAMGHHKTRTILVFLLATAVSAGSLFALSARYSYESAIGPIYQSLSPDARISVDRQKIMASKGETDETKIDWNQYNISWTTWSKYAEALSGASIDFTPRYDETAVVPAADGQIQPVDGKNFTVTGFYDADSSQNGPLGGYTITDGADLTYDQNETATAIIPKALADKNGTKVGDTINLALPSDTSKTFPLKVVGFYENKTSGVTPATGNDINAGNAIYVSYYSFSAAALSPEDENSTANALNVTFMLGTLAQYDQFQTLVKQAGLGDDYVISSPKVEAYTTGIQPLKDLGVKLTPALTVLWSVGGVIAVLLVAWTLSRRSEEIGYDIAVGVGRGTIGWQFGLELLLPGLLGALVGFLGAGFGTAPIIAKLTTQVHGTPLPAQIWPCVWGALATMAVVLVICWIRTACYRTTTLFAARGPVAVAGVDDNTTAQKEA
ncbi:FtsX-like permease family protein [Bifidobacterium vespertilionis]|uniref:ABC transporter permease n=1 Tax=Bifidobacterium vespertilionis TaxID=2562524 RepID=A0A5J5DWM2_9BIFI|nr:ABC transporter permease [Bifidobacterium vespertilionis]KAA8820823.1 ABC transporter permease [Bifidobacterium vespertilionis]KAA8821224.1 ABC transporter permease [Bifidobacterium vespertilionis]